MSDKAVIYARVSTKEQEEKGFSLPAQEKLLCEYAARKGFTIAKVFKISESASGAKQRKVFTEMMAYTRSHAIQHLLCEKVDRLTRNLKEAIVANDWVIEDGRRQLHFVKQNLIIHQDSKSDDKFRWDIEVVLAKKYIANLSEEVRKGQREKIAQGWLPTQPPLGYRVSGERGRRIHVIDEAKAPLVRRMFELYATGEYSVARVTKVMYEEGLRTRTGRKLPRTRVAKLLGYPFYIGKNRWNGTLTPGNQEPLISEDLFQRVQLIMRRGGNASKYRKHVFLFKGLIRCRDCGSAVSWERQKGIVYGHCSRHAACAQRKWYREVDFQKHIAEELRHLQLSQPRLAAWIRKALKELRTSEVEYRDGALSELRARECRIRQQQDILYSDRLDGRIPVDVYDRKRAEMEEELRTILSAVQRHSEADQRYQELGSNIFELAQQAPEIFAAAPVEKKRNLLSLICDELYIENGKLVVRLSDTFHTLALLTRKLDASKLTESELSPVRIFELQKSPYFPTKEDAMSTELPLLCAGRDSNPRRT